MPLAAARGVAGSGCELPPGPVRHRAMLAGSDRHRSAPVGAGAKIMSALFELTVAASWSST